MGVPAPAGPPRRSQRGLLFVAPGPRHPLDVRRVGLRAGEPHGGVLAEDQGPLGEDVPELLRGEIPEFLRGRRVLPVRVQQQPPRAEVRRRRVREDLVLAGAGEGQVEAVKVDVHDLVGESRADVPPMRAEPVVQLDEVLGSGGEFDIRRMRHLTETDDRPGIREPVVPDHLAGHPLRAQVQVVRVGERHVDGGHAGRERLDGVVGQPLVEHGDGVPHRIEVRVAVLDRSVVRHVHNPQRRPEPASTLCRCPPKHAPVFPWQIADGAVMLPAMTTHSVHRMGVPSAQGEC